MSFNNLSSAQAERLALLAEECGEVVKAVGKILRHGYDSVNPLKRNSEDNQEALERECGDVCAAIQILIDAHDISGGNVDGHRADKLDEVWEWMHHAKKLKARP